MEVLAAIVSSLLAEPLKMLFTTIRSEIRNSLNFQSYFDDLDKEMKGLTERRDSVKQDLDSAEKIGLVPRPGVKDWLIEVNKVEADVKTTKAEIQESFHGCKFVCGSRENIKQAVRKKLVVVKGLIEAGSFYNGVAGPVIVEHIPGPYIEYQSTAARNIAQVMDLLSSDEVKRIGVWGMGGVGKTSLLNNVNNKLIKNASSLKQPFSIVIWITVSNKLEELSDLKRVQKEIACRLMMEVEANEGSIGRVAIQLHEKLLRERFLLILDDVWHPIDLDVVGIPRPEIYTGCKILLTTRFSEVCREMMTDRILKVEVLNEQESWLLFRKTAGEVASLEHVEPLAKALTRECCGLPLAIIVVGASMSGKKMVELWEDALNYLRRSEPATRGIENRVYSPLKWSYDSLPSKQIKSGFLFCCLYPEDELIHVDELILYWFAEGLIDEHLNLEEIRNRGITMIECLKDYCLLEQGHKKDTVKMHDVVRDVAVWIASSLEEEYKSLIKSGLGLRTIAEKNILKSAKRISFMCNELNMLPESVTQCPNASTLLLQGNDSLEQIPEKFLQALMSLKVLDLSGCGIKSLPISLKLLVELRALILARCKYLEEVPPVGRLGKLQLLNCCSTNIKALPEGMERLTSLRQLDLSQIRSSTTIRAGTIAELSNLETLSMSRNIGKWFMMNENQGMGSTLFEEILPLERLTVCDIVLDSVPCNISPTDALLNRIKTLKKFRIHIGSIHLHSVFLGDDSTRQVILSGLHFSQEWIGWLFFNATFMQLIHCEGLNQMFEKIAMHSTSVGSFNSLSKLDIAHSQSSFQMTTNCDMQFDLLPNLEILNLRDLSRITCISRLAEHLGLKFRRLRYLRVERCPKLQYLLSLGASIPHLGQLKQISVDSCEELEELFWYDSTTPYQTLAPDAVFPSIHAITLKNLPKLMSFCRLGVIAWPSVQKLEVISCHSLRRISSRIQNAMTAKEI
ncbi:hypothetical protein ACH5RR_037883 [Cinchona calisaya]|uniref:Uncharacterized protein n=1 Tax=Cinchona calisaya TaxID=153742 RepID=A0ABD2YBG7_9GENT